MNLHLVLPHEGAMRWLDALVESGPERTVAVSTVRGDHPLLRAGRLPAFAALELIAQATAARRGLELQARGEGARPGFVVGCPRLELAVADVAVGAELRVEVRPEVEEGEHGLRVYAGEVHAGSVLVARGTLQVYEPRREP